MNEETEIEKREQAPVIDGEEQTLSTDGEEQARVLTQDVPVFDVQKAEEASSFVEPTEQGSLPDNAALQAQEAIPVLEAAPAPEKMSDREEKKSLRNKIRRVTSQVFYGVDLYLFMFTALQGILYLEYSFAAGLSGGILSPEPSDFFYGVFVVIATIAALCLGSLYFSGKAERGVLFERPNVCQEIFEVKERPGPGKLIAFAGLIFLLQILFSFVTGIFELIFNYFGYTLEYSEAMNAEYNTSWTLFLYAVVLGPLAEEVIYRGFLMHGLKGHGRRFAILVSAFVFGMMHGDFQQTMFTMAIGLILGYVAMRYSLWYALLLHIFNNGILGELWVWAIGKMSDELYIGLLIGLLILCAILTVWLIRKGWKGMKAYLAYDRTMPGAWGSLVNLWFILFLAFSITEIVFSISPM